MTRDYEPDYERSGRFQTDRSFGPEYGKTARGGALGGGSGRGGSFGAGRGPQRGYGQGFDHTPPAPSGPIDVSKLDPIIKDVYTEHEEVASQTVEQVAAFREIGEMTIQGKNVPKPLSGFHQAGFPKVLLSKLQAQGFDKPTPIQAQGWPMALSGRNMVGIAQTGSGKTLSFILPALMHIAAQPPLDYGEAAPVVLVLAPTRELAVQIQEVTRIYGNILNVRNAVVYGGAPRGGQARMMQGAQLVIATPGRLIDFIESGQISLHRVSFLVLDEADRMLDMGFEPALRRILPLIRPDRQVLFWSATWPKAVMRLAHDILGRDFIQVNIGSQDLQANKKIKQNVVVCGAAEKEEHLARILQEIWDALPGDEASREIPRMIIFANRKQQCDELAWKLNADQWPACAIHGDKAQNEREMILRDFKRGACPILVATDVAARGLDVKDVHVVINFDFPTAVEDYVHRIGRTARGSAAEGTSFAFITPADKGIVREFIGILEEARQEVPQDLRALQPYNNRFGSGNGRGRGGHNRHGGNNGRGGYAGGRGGHGGRSYASHNGRRPY